MRSVTDLLDQSVLTPDTPNTIQTASSNMFDTPTIRSRVDEMLAELSEQISVNDSQFARRVYAEGIGKYCARLRQYGFDGLGRILDAGCGFGQWSVALSEINREVVGIDASEVRIKGVQALVRRLGLNNLLVRTAMLERLPFEDASFDGVFCYGVIFLSHWKNSLAELARVLRPGGRLYVNANGIGWYLHLWYTEQNRTVDYDPQQIVADALRNTVDYKRGRETRPGQDIIIEPDEMAAEMTRLGLEGITRAPEGLLGLTPGAMPKAKPFFQATYMGVLGVYEMTAFKKQG